MNNNQSSSVRKAHYLLIEMGDAVGGTCRMLDSSDPLTFFDYFMAREYPETMAQWLNLTPEQVVVQFMEKPTAYFHKLTYNDGFTVISPNGHYDDIKFFTDQRDRMKSLDPKIHAWLNASNKQNAERRAQNAARRPSGRPSAGRPSSGHPSSGRRPSGRRPSGRRPSAAKKTTVVVINVKPPKARRSGKFRDSNGRCHKKNGQFTRC
jgi:hypothetical protein